MRAIRWSVGGAVVRRLAVVVGIGVAVALVPLVVPGTAAGAALSVAFACQASAAGYTAGATFRQGVSASAPARVSPFSRVAVTADPAPNRVPASVGGRQVRNVRALALVVPVPGNSSLSSAVLSGGAGLNSRASIVRSGGSVVLRVPGPINGGARFELPTITLNLRSARTGSIVTKLGGASYAVPGLTFTAAVRGPFNSTVNAAARCFPHPSPILTRTAIQ